MSQLSIGDYILDRPIGSGATGKVKLASHKDTGQQVAIKIIKKETFKDHPTLLPKVQREIALMRLLNHPNILALLDVLESEHHIFIVEGYAEHGSLYDVIQSLPRSTSISFFRQIIYGLEYLHLHGICHRDLKPENILLDYANQLWIADFGFACWMPNNVANTSCGSPLYAAPEVIRGVPYDGRIADVWSAGVILFAMLTKSLPFNADSVRQTTQRIKKGIYQIPNNVDPLFQDLIKRIFVVDPRKRITIEQIKAHPAFHVDLPSDYILPQPFPLPQLSDPIQISQGDDEAIQCLQQVGFSDLEELRTQLTSPTPNMAKVFFFMLTQRQNIDNIPWGNSALVPSQNIYSCLDNNNNSSNNNNNSANNYNGSYSNGSSSSNGSSLGYSPSSPSPGGLMYDHAFGEFGSSDRFDFMQPSIGSASLCRSFENAQAWLGGTLPHNNCEEQVIQHISTNAVEMMFILQRFLRAKNFEFFYPDYEQLVARNSQSNLSITLIGDYENESLMDLTIQFNGGTPELFSSVVKQISELFRRMIKNDDEDDMAMGSPFFSPLSGL